MLMLLLSLRRDGSFEQSETEGLTETRDTETHNWQQKEEKKSGKKKEAKRRITPSPRSGKKKP